MSDKLRKRIFSNSSNWNLWAVPVAAAVMLTSWSVPARAADPAAAASNYTDSCADCHGPGGKGDGPKAAELKTKPANYTDCAAMAKFDDDYLVKIIKQGGEALGKGKGMPDFTKAYEDDEIRALVAYVRTFCKK
jgi:mono/diheme cytochrome c family protein